MRITDTAQEKETRNTVYMSKNQTPSYMVHTNEKKAHPSENAKEIDLNSIEDGATVAISAEGLGLSQKEKKKDTTAQEAIERKMYQEMLESANEAAEAQGEGYADMAKALEIARRILNGDIVPAQDEKFLMEYNSEIYMRVKSMAKVKEDPEEYDTLLEEEEDEGTKKNSGSGDISETIASEERGILA